MILVEHDIYRGPRPKLEDLRAGVLNSFKTVISLEGPDEDKKEREALAAAGSKVRFCAMPITSWQIYVSGLTPQLFVSIIECLETQPTPLFVHCQHGEDRTGAIVLGYRLRHGWKVVNAWAEALKYGYRRRINFGLNKTLKNFIEANGYC